MFISIGQKMVESFERGVFWKRVVESFSMKWSLLKMGGESS